MDSSINNKHLNNQHLTLKQRPRRNRRSEAIRKIVQENRLHPENFILPLFIKEGVNEKQPIEQMDGVFRLSTDLAVEKAKMAWQMGLCGLALFPVIPENKKDKTASEAVNENGLLQNTIKAIKDAVPEICLFTDVAMDPYSCDGHDGYVDEQGQILNDPSLDILGQMALSHAQAGADFVAPSDMMDGRVGHIRQHLDNHGFSQVGLLSYTAKYASNFYGPFRGALNSAPKKNGANNGDKKTYQMDPANRKEAIREVLLDIEEGADMVMVKPAMTYLDIISDIKNHVNVPVAAYQVSGEFAMIKNAAKQGLLDEKKAMEEILISIKRAGADIILSYYAQDYAQNYIQDYA